jgi:hypothetical protein
MRHVRSLGFEDLEARKLLSTAKAHPAAHRALHAAPVTVPLALDGTIKVDNGAASTMTNADGSTTTTTPVAGTLSGLGTVRGYWNESVDSFGDALPPDTLRLQNKQGAFVITFNTTLEGKAHRSGHQAIFNAIPQRIYGGTGAYAHATQTGTIQITMSANLAQVQSMALSTPAKT